MGSRTCKQCGECIPGNAGGGLCALCFQKSIQPTEVVVPACSVGTTAPVLRPVSTQGAMTDVDLGPYVLQEEIGRGGMGVVYRAMHRELQRKVAIKLVMTGAGTNRNQQEMFLAEARAAAQVRHPNIVGVHGFRSSTVSSLVAA